MTPKGLSREGILAAALELADREGLGALSMRRLGQALGVEAMSLYNHVANKVEVLDGLVELVLAEVELPSPGREWDAELRRATISMHDALRRHPWSCALVMAPARWAGALQARARYIEALLATLREGGFTPELAYHAYHSLDAHAVGFTMWELGHAVPDDVDVADIREEIARGAFPYLLEHAREHDAEHQTPFEFGLD